MQFVKFRKQCKVGNRFYESLNGGLKSAMHENLVALKACTLRKSLELKIYVKSLK